jgi:tRNA (cytidine/uridine-2'-O-)-methyltransferase
MIHVVLYEPEIPPNTGNIIRLCANTGSRLHLIRPLGFEVDDRRLRRAGLDYREWARMSVHESFAAFTAACQPPRVWAASTRGQRLHTSPRYRRDDALLFGPESRGLPAALLQGLGARRVLRLPMVAGSRSLNLSNAVAVMVYEVWRQLGFEGGS